MHHPTDKIAHTTAFVTPVVEHWLEREIDQWVHPMKDRNFSHYVKHLTVLGIRLNSKCLNISGIRPNDWFNILTATYTYLSVKIIIELFLVPASAPRLV